MKIRTLIAVTNHENRGLIQSMLESALDLIPLKVVTNQAHSEEELLKRAEKGLDDLVFLDWALAGVETPDLTRRLLEINPCLRVIVLLPLQLRQYRQRMWEAGVCTCTPKEHLDQEWLCSILCLIHQSMEREARLLG